MAWSMPGRHAARTDETRSGWDPYARVTRGRPLVHAPRASELLEHDGDTVTQSDDH